MSSINFPPFATGSGIIEPGFSDLEVHQELEPEQKRKKPPGYVLNTPVAVKSDEESSSSEEEFDHTFDREWFNNPKAHCRLKIGEVLFLSLQFYMAKEWDLIWSKIWRLHSLIYALCVSPGFTIPL